MNSIVFENVCKAYGEAKIVKSLNLKIREGRAPHPACLPAAAKLQLLRMIAGWKTSPAAI